MNRLTVLLAIAGFSAFATACSANEAEATGDSADRLENRASEDADGERAEAANWDTRTRFCSRSAAATPGGPSTETTVYAKGPRGLFKIGSLPNKTMFVLGLSSQEVVGGDLKGVYRPLKLAALVDDEANNLWISTSQLACQTQEECSGSSTVQSTDGRPANVRVVRHPRDFLASLANEKNVVLRLFNGARVEFARTDLEVEAVELETQDLLIKTEGRDGRPTEGFTYTQCN